MFFPCLLILNLSIQDHFLWQNVKRNQHDLRYVAVWNSTCLSKCTIQMSSPEFFVAKPDGAKFFTTMDANMGY